MLDLEDCCWWTPNGLVLQHMQIFCFVLLFSPHWSCLIPHCFKSLASSRRRPDGGAAGCRSDLMSRIQECDSLRALWREEERLWVIPAESSVQPAAAAFNFTATPPPPNPLPPTASITIYPPSPLQPACLHLHAAHTYIHSGVLKQRRAPQQVFTLTCLSTAASGWFMTLERRWRMTDHMCLRQHLHGVCVSLSLVCTRLCVFCLTNAALDYLQYM